MSEATDYEYYIVLMKAYYPEELRCQFDNGKCKIRKEFENTRKDTRK